MILVGVCKCFARIIAPGICLICSITRKREHQKMPFNSDPLDRDGAIRARHKLLLPPNRTCVFQNRMHVSERIIEKDNSETLHAWHVNPFGADTIRMDFLWHTWCCEFCFKSSFQKASYQLLTAQHLFICPHDAVHSPILNLQALLTVHHSLNQLPHSVIRLCAPWRLLQATTVNKTRSPFYP